MRRSTLLCSLLLTTCAKPTPPVVPTEPTPPTPPSPVQFEEDAELRGLKMELRDARPSDGAEEALSRPATVALSPTDTARLLARLPALDAPPTSDFSLRPASSLPPRTGATVVSAFPPPVTPSPAPEVESGPLKVLRFAPQGEVPMVPHLSITFSQPMVALSSQEEAAKQVPVRITPEIPGARWQWLGTKTLLYSMPNDQHLPMATEYKVEIPEGTPSAVKGALEKAVSFSFSTPALQVVRSSPSGYSVGLEPTIVVGFDQAVNVEALLPHLFLNGNGASVPLRLATAEEQKAVGDWGGDIPATQRIYLRPTRTLERATWYDLKVAAGTPSAEGPRLTAGDQHLSFQTYTPLKVQDSGCGNGRQECPPTAPWSVWFNNALDDQAFDPSLVTVEPSIPGLQVQQSGGYITLQGDLTGRTVYTVKISPKLQDTFGQTLGKEAVFQWKVGSADKTLEGPGQEVVVMDPVGGAKFPVWSTNHNNLKVRIWRESPETWALWSAWMQKHNWEDRNPGPPPGEKVADLVVPVNGTPDRRTETDIDLGKYTSDGVGQFLVWIEPTVQAKERWNRAEVLAWVQVTQLGLSAFVDQGEMLVWANKLGDGSPVDGVQLSLLPSGVSGHTGADGLASLALPRELKANGPDLLVARRGNDLALLPRTPSWYESSNGWINSTPGDELRWYVFDDRGMYKPGEEVRIKGWLRRNNPGKGGDLASLGDHPTRIKWTLTSSRGIALGQGETKVSGLGGFDLGFKLPPEADLGTAWLTLQAEDAGLSNWSYGRGIEIQEFRRPEYEVSVSTDPSAKILGGDAELNLSASYYAGGGLPSAEVNWYASATPASFVPPDRQEWSFGPWSPWWRSWYPDAGNNAPAVQLQGKTDSTGQHHAALHFVAMNPPRPMSVHAEASVMDVNRQAWNASTDMLVHPSSLYVGLKTPRNFVEKGQTVEVDALTVDLEGKEAHGVPVELHFSRVVDGYRNGSWKTSYEPVGDCNLTDGGHCSFRPTVGGDYQVLAKVKDKEGRLNQSELRVWVTGDVTPSRGVEQQEVTLIPDQREHQPGDVAKIMVQAPFYPAEAVLSLRRSGLVETRRFRMEEPTTIVEVPITEAYLPDLTVQVDLAGSAPRTDDQGNPRSDLPRRVAYASGAVTFKIPPLRRTLKVEASAPKATSPGAQTSIDLLVRDADGKPVRDAELAVIVADESVLALSGYRLPDPMEIFYSARGAGVADYHSRAQVILENPRRIGGLGMQGAGEGGGGRMYAEMSVADDMDEAKPDAPGGGAPMKKAVSRAAPQASAAAPPPMEANLRNKDNAAPTTPMATTPIAQRTDFSALALFAPSVRTDANGHATVPLKLPDSLTRYRIMVVAVAGGQQFGTGESNITARLPLMVRPSAPRFLNFGDRFELPVVLQNQTDAPLTVDVGVRAGNVLFYDQLPASIGQAGGTDTAGRRLTIPANNRVEVRFPAATMMAGKAAFQVAAASGNDADAATFDLPVWTPATTEAFATYGDIASGSTVQPVKAPADVWPQFGGLEVTTSSTQLQALTDAVLYLVSYPYDCNEQIASRILAIGALRDVLGAFHAEGLPDAATLQASVDDDLARLKRRQNGDGGFAFWRRGDESWPYLTIHVGTSLGVAKAKGYEVPKDLWNDTLAYLRVIESHIPHWYSQEEKLWLRAAAIGARHRMGDNDVTEAARIWKLGGTKLSVEAQGWLWPVLAKRPEGAEIRASLMSKVEETAGAAMFVTGSSDSSYVLLNSDRRSDAVVLDAMLELEPMNDVVPKVVRGLLAHRVAGHWSNTQENAYVLLALDHYFRVYEKETPDFVARAWLGEGYAGDHTFKGRTTDRGEIQVPMDWLQKQKGQQDLVLQRDGNAGRLYYRVGMRYAPKSLEIEPMDAGFVVQRSYEAVDHPEDVRHDADGSWHLKAGARVRVRLNLVAPARRYHVALVDPLPAGLEVMNPDLAVTGTLPQDPAAVQNPWDWWNRTWYEHENFRDDRVEAFTSLLWDGVYNYSYVTRATTPGQYVVPPTRVEEMYSPETFGRAGTDWVVVE